MKTFLFYCCWSCANVTLQSPFIHVCNGIGVGHKVVGNIWCSGVGELSLHPIRVANLASP